MNPVSRLLIGLMMLETILCSASWAQGQALDSDPPGMYLSIRGPVTVSGRAPLSLSHLPGGKYSLVAQGPGIAAARGRFLRNERGLVFHPWAGPSALLQPPGLVHLQRNDRRGWYHVWAATLSGVLWAVSYDSAKEADPVAKADEQRIRNIWAGYFGLVWLGAGVEAWLFTPQPAVTSAGPGRQLATFPRVNRWKATLGSALAPGAGQRYLGRSKRGTIFSSVVAASAAGAILGQDAFLEARRDEAEAQRRLDLADTPESVRQAAADLASAASNTDSKSTLRWALVGVTAYFYLWNVVDAFVLGQRAETPSSAPRVSLAPSPSGFHLTMSFGFP